MLRLPHRPVAFGRVAHLPRALLQPTTERGSRVCRSSASCRHSSLSSYEPVPFMQLRGLCSTHGGRLHSPSRTLYLAFAPRPIRKYPAIELVMRVPLGTNHSCSGAKSFLIHSSRRSSGRAARSYPSGPESCAAWQANCRRNFRIWI